jgi:antitoxin PrlF
MTVILGRKGQVTIPKAIREAAGLKAGDRVEVRAEPGKGIFISAVSNEEIAARRAEILAGIEDMQSRRVFQGYTADELMALTRGND